jgi:hypothetical protein
MTAFLESARGLGFSKSNERLHLRKIGRDVWRIVFALRRTSIARVGIGRIDHRH